MKRMIEDGISLLTGAGIGIAAMYLLDPDSGRKRRRQIASGARQTLGTVAASASHLGRRAVDRAEDRASDLVEAGKRYVADASESMSETASESADRAASWGRSLLDRSRGLIPHFGPPRESRTIGPVTGAIGGVALFAAGATLVYFLDPYRGRRRRAEVINKGFHAVSETGELFRRAGKHVADRLRGRYHETAAQFRHEKPTDAQLIARVRAQLGHVLQNIGSVQVVADEGYITVRGELPAEMIEPAIRSASSVRGVRGVNSQLHPLQESATAEGIRPTG